VRDQVLGCLGPHLGDLAAYAIVIDKRGLAAEMRCAERLYPTAFAKLVDNAMAGEEGGARPARVIVVTDTLPVLRERLAVTKALKLALHERAKDAFEYRILHHASLRPEPAGRRLRELVRAPSCRKSRPAQLLARGGVREGYRRAWGERAPRETRPPRLSLRKSPLASCHRGGSFDVSVPGTRDMAS